MSPSLEYLERCAAETGYRVGALEKVVRLGELAADIARHPFLGAVLALKGGTALNLCFRPPARLSVDLDFNYIGQAGREKMLADRPRVETAVEQLARRWEYTVQRSADAFAGRKLYLGYGSVLGPNQRIEVDLNFLFRVPLAGTETREMWQPGELERPRLRVVSLAGPQDPERTGPWPVAGAEGAHRALSALDPPPCAPCLSRRCTHPAGPLCMTGIDPSDVLRALDSTRAEVHSCG